MSEKQKTLQLREEHGESDEGVWFISLADMMSLLMTFFILLYSMSALDTSKYTAAVQSITSALGVQGSGAAGGGGGAAAEQVSWQKLSEDIRTAVSQENLQQSMEVTQEKRGIILYANGGVFFESGTATLDGGFRPFLFRMADLLKRVPYKVLVEGHTDDVPISPLQFPSNWELSSSRASSVVRFFIEETGLPPERFSAVGYASYKPRFGATPENRARNRRVEIIILKE